MPDLTMAIRQSAPGVSLHARAANPEQVYAMLDDGLIDIAVGRYGPAGPRHREKKLFTQSLMCCFNPKLLPLQAPLDRATYLRQRHALVSQRDNIKGCLELALTKSGVEIDVAMAAPECLTVLSAISTAPLIATLPARIVRKYAGLFGLATSPVPLEMDANPVSLLWSAHSDADLASQWLRSQIELLIESADGMAA